MMVRKIAVSVLTCVICSAMYGVGYAAEVYVEEEIHNLKVENEARKAESQYRREEIDGLWNQIQELQWEMKKLEKILEQERQKR